MHHTHSPQVVLIGYKTKLILTISVIITLQSSCIVQLTAKIASIFNENLQKLKESNAHIPSNVLLTNVGLLAHEKHEYNACSL